MYYYIFESVKENNKLEDLHEKIKEYVSNLGIAGEMTSPSHARSLDYLISQAFEKKYSTIVGVGGIKHITEISSKLVGSGIVFGIIPTTPLPDLYNLINISNWQDAALALKPRRYIETKLGVIEPGNHIFLSTCTIPITNNSTASIHFSKFNVEDISGTVKIRLNSRGNSLLFEIEQNIKKNVFSFFKTSKDSRSNQRISLFSQLKGQIITNPPSVILIDNTEISQTPALISLHPKKLNLIVAKKTS